ncbi:MAG: J domain-containing protein [Firmicutes bacterium]|nr:J domain-containing protein [Bacillota bacterium]
MEYKDYYKILGVEKTATQDEIKKAYRKMAKLYHPDKTKGDKAAEEKFKEANEAFEVLGDEEKRKKYDQFGQYGNFQGGMNFDPNDFADMFGGFSGFSGGGFSSAGTGGFSDFFSAMFGGMNGASGGGGRYQTYTYGDPYSGFSGMGGTSGRGAYSHARTGQDGCGSGCASGGCQDKPSYDLETKMKIKLKDAFEGKTTKVSFNAGEGKKTISVKIPAGIESGKKIKLKDQGRKAPDGSHGNLMIEIDIQTEKGQVLKGKDLHETIEVAPWEAYLGTEKIVNTLDGKIKVKIPAGIKNGQKIKLSGKGYRNMKGTRGDLYIEAVVNNPDELPEEVIEAYKKANEKSKD